MFSVINFYSYLRSVCIPASWSPANDSVGAWLAVSFHSPVIIENIQMRGEDSSDKYVSKFKLQYQYDASSPWYWVTNTDKSVAVSARDSFSCSDKICLCVRHLFFQSISLKLQPGNVHKSPQTTMYCYIIDTMRKGKQM